MFSHDLLIWLVNGVDAYLTGQHNSAVEQMRNPKAKRTIPKKYSGEPGDTFMGKIAPERWRSAYAQHQSLMTEKKKDQKEEARNETEAIIRFLKMGRD